MAAKVDAENVTESPHSAGGEGSPTGVPHRLLIVDGDRLFLSEMVQAFKDQGFSVRGLKDPVEAVDALRTEAPDVLLADISVRGLRGLEPVRIALEESPDIAVVALSRVKDPELPIRAFRLGVSDYLLKPCTLDEVSEAVETALARRDQAVLRRNAEARIREEAGIRAREAEERRVQLEKVTVGVLGAMIRALEARTPHFDGHSRTVANLSGSMAEELSLSSKDVWHCRTAGFLHDIGMIAVPDRILEKATELTPEESASIREHCALGKEILTPFSHLGPVSELVLMHHERVDGSGYPRGLKERQIPLLAQLVAMAESYAALVQSRPFRPAYSPREAMEILRGTEGIWHSQKALDALAGAIH
jgi:putative two-component system response regulator